MRPRGPRSRPSLPTLPIRSGVAMAMSKSRNPPEIRSTRSSAPTTSAPASLASWAAGPWAKTATRTVLPVPLGSETAPRIIWSAFRGSTPRRKAASTVSSKFRFDSDLTSSNASAGVWICARSNRRVASVYFLPRWGIVVLFLLAPDLDTHRPGGTGHLGHGAVEVDGIEVGHLRLGDLLELSLGDRAHLRAPRVGRALLEAGGLTEQDRCRRGLGDERERPVLVDRDLGRHHHAPLGLGRGVVHLAEVHDVDAVGAQGGTHGRGRRGLPGGDLDADDSRELLLGHADSWGLELGDLAELELDGRLPPENVDEHLEFRLVDVDLTDGAVEIGEGAGDDPDLLADVELEPGAGLLLALHAAFDLLHAEDRLDLLAGERSRFGTAADEPGDAGRVAHDPPRVVVEVQADEEIAGEDLLRHHRLPAGLELDDVLHGDDDLEDPLLHVHGADPAGQVRLHLVLVAGVGVDDEPLPRAVVRTRLPRTGLLALALLLVLLEGLEQVGFGRQVTGLLDDEVVGAEVGGGGGLGRGDAGVGFRFGDGGAVARFLDGF